MHAFSAAGHPAAVETAIPGNRGAALPAREDAAEQRHARSLLVLDAIQIARPCPAEWEEMRPVAGQQRQRVRHCQQCNLRVYNLSAMKRADAEALVHASEGRMCVRLYRRDDGTVLTADCTFLRRAANLGRAGARRAGWIAFCSLAAFVGAAAWAGSLLMERAASRGQATVMQTGLDRLAQMPMLNRIFAWTQPRQTIVLGRMAAPQGWLASDIAPPDINFEVQGEIGYEPQVVPTEPVQRWLDIDDEHRVPL